MRVDERRGVEDRASQKVSFERLLPAAGRQPVAAGRRTQAEAGRGSPAPPGARRAPPDLPLPGPELGARSLRGSQQFERRLWQALSRSAQAAQGREEARLGDRQLDLARPWAPEARAEGRWSARDLEPEREAALAGPPPSGACAQAPVPQGPVREPPPEPSPTAEREGQVRELHALVERAELFLRDGAPSLRLTLEGRARGSVVELSRNADRSVSVRLRAPRLSGAEARAAAADIRRALGERGLGVGRVEVTRCESGTGR